MMGKRLFAAAALLLLALPVLLAPWGLDMRSYRSDTLTASFAEDPAGFLADRLALRNAAITLRSRLLGLIGESGSEQVIRGREGFLYFQPTIADHQGTAPLTAEERSALAAKLAALRDELASQGRGLIVLIAPDKCAVYPEYMPAHILPAGEDGLQRLNADLRDAGLTVLDAQALLTARKQEGLMYFRGDSHWNARGARLVYQELMRLTGTADAPSYDDAPLLADTAGDLLLLCQPGTPPTEPDAAPQIERVYRASPPMRTVDDARIRTTSPTTDLSLLVIRDSFGRALFPYLANTAGRMTFSRSDTDVPSQAASAHADWVIIEIVQRNLRDWLKSGSLLPE